MLLSKVMSPADSRVRVPLHMHATQTVRLLEAPQQCLTACEQHAYLRFQGRCASRAAHRGSRHLDHLS